MARDEALLVNPTEVFEIYEAMKALATKPNLRKELKNKGLEKTKEGMMSVAKHKLEFYSLLNDGTFGLLIYGDKKSFEIEVVEK